MKKYDPNNIFAKIIKGDIPCNKVYEDTKILAFHDINPAAPIHVLVLPKGEYASFDDFVNDASEAEVTNFFKMVKKIASDLDLTETGYRLIVNHGPDASQTIPHFHTHILGKRKLGALVVGDTYHK